MKKSPTIRLLALLTLCLIILGSNAFGSGSISKSITLIGTSDLQGVLEPSMQEYRIDGKKEKKIGGGISRIASILKQAKSDNPDGTIIASNGDDLMGRYFHIFKGEAIYSLMDQSGYELYAPGNHEFDKGPDVFADALKYAKFDMICSDLLIKNTALEGKCVPYKIIEKHGAKIGFFSLMTDDLALITSPRNVKLKKPNFTTAKEMVKILQDQRCDIIIALTHIGIDQDKKVAKNVKGIDVIFGGHSHQYLERFVRINDTLIFNGGEQGSDVVKLDLPLDADHHIKKSEAKYDLIPVIDPIKKDSRVQASLEAFKSQLPSTIILGKTTVEWNLTTKALREGESTVADLINDLLRDKFHVDIVMNNAGAFRGKKIYPPGNITDTMLHEIDDFNNNAYIFTIRGKQLREILERSGTQYGGGGLLQVSGLRYTIDLNKQAQVIKKKSDGVWVIEKQGKRISNIEIESVDGTNTPLEDDKSYRILSNSYLVNNGGNGYFWFKQYGKNQKNTYTTFYTVMVDYIEKNKIINPKSPDGRLKILK